MINQKRFHIFLIRIEMRKMRMYRGIFIADIHIGAMKYDDTYDGCMYLKDLLKSYTKEGPLDFIIIGGDFFDKQLYANDPFINLAQKLMIYILSCARIVRIVNGTSSHDSDQYGLFDTFIEDMPFLTGDLRYNLKVINTVTEEELLPGLNVLYIPEEYIFDKREYYEPYLSKKNHYDYIFGHGMIYEALSFKVKESPKVDHIRRKAPVFNSEELSYACKGKVYFGHEHHHAEILDKVFYVGSFFRWKFGEEEDKGFFFLTCNPEEGKYNQIFVVNEKSLKYVTITYGYKDSVFQSSEEMEKEAKEILKKKLKYGINYLKVIFNIPVGYENPEGLIHFWKERFKGQPNIKLEFSNGYVADKKKMQKEDVRELTDEHRILLDENIPKNEKVSYFLKIRKGVEMSPERVTELLGSEEEK